MHQRLGDAKDRPLLDVLRGRLDGYPELREMW
jgi:hypothetical protein